MAKSKTTTGEKYTLHVYDIELCRLQEKLKSTVSLLKKEDPDTRQYLSSFKSMGEVFKDYLKSKKITSITAPLIIDPASNYYNLLLAFALSELEVHKIPAFLDYQEAHFPGNNDAQKNNFHGLVEFRCINNVKRFSLQDTESRLRTIMEWVVEHKREIKSKSKHSNNLSGKNQYLEWKGTKDELQFISDELNDLGYTKSRMAFKNVFDKQSVCQWKKDPDVMVHLIYTLHQLNKIGNANGGKAYFKVAQSFFVDDEGSTPFLFSWPGTAYVIRKRQSEKYTKVRNFVEKLLKRMKLAI